MDQLNYIPPAAIAEQYLERESLAPASKLLLSLSVFIACLCLTGVHKVLWKSHFNKTLQVAPATVFKLTIRAPEPKTIEPSPTKTTPTEAPLKPQNAPQPPATKTVQKTINQDKTLPENKRRTAALIAPAPNLEPALSAPAQNSNASAQPWDNVFDSQLRNRLQQRSQSMSQQQTQLKARAQISTYRNLDNSQEVLLNGRCFTETPYSASPTGIKWSLPHRCKGQLTDSQRFARGLKQAMDARFPKENTSH